MAHNNPTPRRRGGSRTFPLGRGGDDALRGTKATQRALEAAFMRPLRSITAYNGWLILEYSEMVNGKPESRFAVQYPPHGPMEAGNSLNEAKQAINGSSVKPAMRPKGVQGSDQTGRSVAVRSQKATRAWVEPGKGSAFASAANRAFASGHLPMRKGKPHE